jgi:hypothetical protein
MLGQLSLAVRPAVASPFHWEMAVNECVPRCARFAKLNLTHSVTAESFQRRRLKATCIY